MFEEASAEGPPPKRHRGPSDESMHAQILGTLPSEYRSAGIIPYNANGFWLGLRHSESGLRWSDFTGKRQARETCAWTTAVRECKEASGLDLSFHRLCRPPIYTAHQTKCVVFWVETLLVPVAGAHPSMVEYKQCQSWPSPLHIRLSGGNMQVEMEALGFGLRQAGLLEARPRPQPKASPSLAFMNAAAQWRFIHIDSEYVPPIGTTHEDFVPRPPTQTDVGHTLAIHAGCGRAKSYAVRVYIASVLQSDPCARILMMSANILYGGNLTHDLRQAGFDVCFYNDLGVDKGELAKHSVNVCSLESLHHVDRQRFDVILIDEVRHIASLVGGPTMNWSFGNLFLLRDMWHAAPRRIICDADLLYTASDTETSTLVQDFMSIIDSRPIVCASLTCPPPVHLRRSVRLFYAHHKWNRNEKAWLDEIRRAVAAWRVDPSQRIAICVGSKAQMRHRVQWMGDIGVPCKPYSGDTRKDSKSELSDPDTAWVDYGCIISTTTLSIGVDPSIQFARVFVQTCRTGCSVLAQLQAACRYGRSAHAPLTDPVISILLDCIPPALQAVKPTTTTYECTLKRLAQLRRTRLYVELRGHRALGGRIEGVAAPEPLTQQLLRLLAHTHPTYGIDRRIQASDLRFAVMRGCAHHGWDVDDEPTTTPLPDTTTMARLSPAEMDNDDAFTVTLTHKEQYERLLEYVRAQGEKRFFSDCYGFCAEDGGIGSRTPNLGFEQMLVRMFWLLRPVQRLESADTLCTMDDTGVLSGLELNALSRCITARDQMERDRGRSHVERRVAHPFLRVSKGLRMEAAEDCARLLGIESMFREADLPQRVVDAINREKNQVKLEDGDDAFVSALRTLASTLQTSAVGQLPSVLRGIARACGMLCVIKRGKVQTDLVRQSVVLSISISRVLPSIVDDWHVWSARLGGGVRVTDWQAAHLPLDDEEMALAWEAEMATFMQAEDAVGVERRLVEYAHRPAEGVRVEMIDGQALVRESKRLQAQTTRTKRDQRTLKWVEAAIRHASRPTDDSTVWTLIVQYSKRHSIGRRSATHPSAQLCPTTLRPMIYSAFYHDIDLESCHPSLMLQVSQKMGVQHDHLAPLHEYVHGGRAVMLASIGEFYGVHPSVCKYAILRVLNGGSWEAWCRDAECPQNSLTPHPTLLDFTEISRVVRVAFFKMFRNRASAIQEELRCAGMARLKSAESRCSAATTSTSSRAMAMKAICNAKAKLTKTAPDRSRFSLCIFELEDAVLDCIVGHFEANGWTVASLIFDGFHVEHRDDADVDSAMRGAEMAVASTLGYTVKLTEKPLYAVAAEDVPADAWIDDECDSEDEDV